MALYCINTSQIQTITQLPDWQTNQLTNYKKDSPSWEATSSSASQEIPCIL
jgi:hypothetical protein